MFHVIDSELKWRRENGAAEGFGSLKRFRPLVAVGPEKPLEDQIMMADYFRTCLSDAAFHMSDLTLLCW